MYEEVTKGSSVHLFSVIILKPTRVNSKTHPVEMELDRKLKFSQLVEENLFYNYAKF